MRILLDESVPRRLKALLGGHEAMTVREAGWASYSNGELLARASQRFDVLVTADQKLPHQQNLPKFDIAVVVMVAKTNTMVDYELGSQSESGRLVHYARRGAMGYGITRRWTRCAT